MKIQVNSDKTIAVDTSLTGFVETEVNRLLGRFDKKLTRVEVHLSDVDNRKPGADGKRCLVEARPRGAQPLSTTAKAAKMGSAIAEALGKMQRLLTTFYGRIGREPVTVSGRVSKPRKTVAKKAAAPKKKAAVEQSDVKKPAKPGIRRPKKKRIYQARRKPWPTR